VGDRFISVPLANATAINGCTTVGIIRTVTGTTECVPADNQRHAVGDIRTVQISTARTCPVVLP
jgi:predicted ThiF/HesA family dinucleotide-utilizing enzyme